MSEKRISLIIPAHNEERYIKPCLEYALRNSEGLVAEIIVVDNASSDKTSELSQKFENVRVVFEERKGLTRAREAGFRNATGDLIAYIDADTRMPPGWCKRALQEFEKNPNLVCVSGPYVYYDIPRWQGMFVWLYWRLLVLPGYYALGYMVVGGNFMIRRDVLDKMNGFDLSIEFYGEDANIARRAHQFGKVKFVPQFVMHTSGRRFAGQGIAKTAGLYVLNFISEVLLRRPATSAYKDIR